MFWLSTSLWSPLRLYEKPAQRRHPEYKTPGDKPVFCPLSHTRAVNNYNYVPQQPDVTQQTDFSLLGK